MPFYPGPGLGGHCIPVDPYYLSWKAREYDFATRFIELAGEINTAMPYHVVDAVAAALNERQKSLKGSKILLLGVAYKKDVDDLRESPSLKLLELLTERGAMLDYNDPYFPALFKMRHYDFSKMKSVELTPEHLASYDCVADRHRPHQLRLRGHRPQLEAGCGFAQRHPAREVGRGKNHALLVRRALGRVWAWFAVGNVPTGK